MCLLFLEKYFYDRRFIVFVTVLLSFDGFILLLDVVVSTEFQRRNVCTGDHS